MAAQLYVIKYNETTDLFCIFFSTNYSKCRWGSINDPDLVVRYTLAEVQTMALSINSGTVGTPKP
jgi:hypothetical protein